LAENRGMLRHRHVVTSVPLVCLSQVKNTQNKKNILPPGETYNYVSLIFPSCEFVLTFFIYNVVSFNLFKINDIYIYILFLNWFSYFLNDNKLEYVIATCMCLIYIYIYLMLCLKIKNLVNFRQVEVRHCYVRVTDTIGSSIALTAHLSATRTRKQEWQAGGRKEIRWTRA
jgi:hypothetical protein